MTKEELEKEAEEYADTKVKDRKGYNARWELVRNAYIAEAEPREKRIAKLEELFINFKNLSDTIEKAQKEQIDDLEKEKCELLGIIQGKDKAIKDFEKENANLKTDYKVLSCSVGNFDKLQEKLEEEQRKNNGLSDNLTKAKEIIKELLDTQSQLDQYRDIFKDRILKAEQFISEVEK